MCKQGRYFCPACHHTFQPSPHVRYCNNATVTETGHQQFCNTVVPVYIPIPYEGCTNQFCWFSSVGPAYQLRFNFPNLPLSAHVFPASFVTTGTVVGRGTIFASGAVAAFAPPPDVVPVEAARERAGPYSNQELEQLKQGIVAGKSYEQIAREMPGRTAEALNQKSHRMSLGDPTWPAYRPRKPTAQTDQR